MPRAPVVAVLAVCAALLGAGPAYATSVTGLSVDNAAPTQAEGAQTVYVVKFTTPGGVPAPGGITLGFPTGTGFAGYNGSSVVDTTSGAAVGNCGGANGQGLVMCGMFAGQSIPQGHAVAVTLNGVANTATAGVPRTLSVTTTSEQDAASAPVTIVPANPLTGLTVDNATPTAAAGGQTVYKIRFTTSATGALSRAANSAISLTFPAGTTFAGYNGSSIDVGGTSVGNCGGANQLTIACGLFTGQSIAAGAAVTITLNGIANPSAGSPVVTASTTSDPATVRSTFNVVAANPVTGVTVDNTSPTTASGGRTIYAIRFTASATGALSRAANSAIALTFPTGTAFAGYNGSSVVDTDAGGASIGNCGGASGLTVTCGLFTNQAIPAGHHVAVTLNGIANPGPGSPSVSVSTTSDPAVTPSAPFTVAPANQLTAVTADNSTPTAAAGGRTIYSVAFTVSATGALSRDANSAISLTLPAGTTFAGYNGSSVVDTTAGSASIGNCGGANGLTVVCGLFTGQAIPAGHRVAITLNGVANPGAGSPTVAVSTTSDPASVNSAPFAVSAANPLTGVTVIAGSAAPSATTTYAVGFTTSTSGALSRAANSAIALTFPAGTTFAGQGSSSVVDTTAGAATVGNCGGAVIATRTISCGLFTGQSIAAGHRVVINVAGITNPPGAGPYALTVSTTSDPQAIAANASTGPPAATITDGPSGVTTEAAPAFAFGAGNGSVTFECRLDGPGGTGTFAACVSPKTYSGLPPGQYTFLVRSVDAAGNPSLAPASRSFTVASPQQATPTPTPSPTATPTPTPTPVPGKTVVAQAVKGTVRVRLPGTNTFVDLDGTQGIPVGATVDTRHGTVQLTALQKPGAKAGRASFFDGQFKLTQTKTTTDLTLNEPLAPCASRSRASAAAAKKKPKTRKLWGSGHGSFRTRGQYSAATVRGTKWLVQDSCAGTLTRVTQGVVSVRDNVRRKTITLRAGKRYLARPRR